MTSLLVESHIEGLKLFRRGKVRDIYDLGSRLLMIATDRLSAFDYVLPTPIPDKGKFLTQASAFWFRKTAHIIANHLISADLTEIQKQVSVPLDSSQYEGRTMLVRKADRIDAECVVRGYLAGSGWKEYQKTGMVGGHKLPAGLKEASALPLPIFTPATKNDQGHDENITREQLADLVGLATAKELEKQGLRLYEFAADYLREHGLILADTKFEFGHYEGKLIAIDEMLTPDSSRLWPTQSYEPGSSPPSFDKQFVRDYLEGLSWNKKPPVPSLPQKVAEGTASRYQEFLKALSA